MQNTHQELSKQKPVFTATPSISKRANRKNTGRNACPAADLTYFKLVSQEVRFANRTLSKLESITTQANLESVVAPIKDAMPIIKALSESGHLPQSKLIELRLALTDKNYQCLSNWLSSALESALASINNSLCSEIYDVLKTLPKHEVVLPHLNDLSLYRLKAESEFSDGTGLKIYYGDCDFFQHFDCNLLGVDEAHRAAFASLINLTLNKGDGVWQTEATGYTVGVLRTVSSIDELNEVKAWVQKIVKAEPEELSVLCQSEHVCKPVKHFIEDLGERCYDDICDLDFDDPDMIEMLINMAEESIAWHEAYVTLNQLSGAYSSFKGIAQAITSTDEISQAIQAIAVLAEKESKNYNDVFTPKEESWIGYGFVLKPFDEKSNLAQTLDALSEQTYNDLMQCDEANDVQIIGMENRDWFAALRQRMLFTALTMYLVALVNPILMPEIETVAS